METTAFKHRVPLQIRFNDIDALGHLNNSVYFTFFDLGKSNYFETVRPDLIDWNKIDLVIANINADFLSPVYRHDSIAVETAVARIGNKSMQMIQRVIDTTTNEVKCVCSSIMVGLNLRTGETLPISDEWRKSISAYEGNPALNETSR